MYPHFPLTIPRTENGSRMERTYRRLHARKQIPQILSDSISSLAPRIIDIHHGLRGVIGPRPVFDSLRHSITLYPSRERETSDQTKEFIETVQRALGMVDHENEEPKPDHSDPIIGAVFAMQSLFGHPLQWGLSDSGVRTVYLP